ncbi:hypothetical protein F5Y16DRAFT_394682 [Xylariaceae sp. FL0255]|nr:hypothetical protein F5Y16DRAFT_394682 [Xylariaceae sp. FL0255]
MAAVTIFSTPGQIPGSRIGQKRKRQPSSQGAIPEVNSARYVQVPRSSNKICTRCGHVSGNYHCDFCFRDFTRIIDDHEDYNSDDDKRSQYDDVKALESDGNRHSIYVDAIKDNDAPHSPDDPNHSCFFTPEQRLRQIREAEAAIDVQLQLLRRERERLNESGDNGGDESLYRFARYDLDLPRGPLFAAADISGKRKKTRPSPA